MGFPLYDTHGNNVGSVNRHPDTVNHPNEFQLGNERTYDAWGAIKTGSNYPQQGYCASIGHRLDDESSLAYMRARYYEPSTGRFVSEDPAMDGSNWFAYCSNNPVNYLDFTGKWKITGKSDYFNGEMFFAMLFFSTAALLCVADGWAGVAASRLEKVVKVGLLGLAAFHFSEAIGETSFSSERAVKFLAHLAVYAGILGTSAEGMSHKANKGIGGIAVMATAAYSLMVLGLLISTTCDE
ncbi:MAG: RHS repeat-associated core domain-containing protein [Chthonomonadaceae bacterium]|nr:RHS repeat-associated core domain-containing protein [Chthonomonadaceae bacterium]